MPSGRISLELAKEREQFAIDVFKREPTLSVAKANEKIKEKYHTMIRVQRMYELRKKAQKEVGHNGHAPATAARRPNRAKARKPTAKGIARKPTHAARAMNVRPVSRGNVVVITGNADNMKFMSGVFETMRGAGMAVPVIDHQTDTYAVVKAS